MSLVRKVARPLFASVFIWGGIDALRHPGGRVQKAKPLVDKVAPILGAPADAELAVRANGAVMAAAGTMYALGRAPRTSAAVLAASLLPTTYTGHPFWSESDPTMRQMQMTHFMKNLSMFGALMVAALDTEGKPGVAYRSRMVASQAQRSADRTKRDALRAARRAQKDARHQAEVLKLRAQQSLPTT